MKDWPGLGVMIQQLGGDYGGEIVKESVGKTISEISLDEDNNNSLRFVFSDGSKMALVDNGQSCCEQRYMSTDDDLPYFIGSVFNGLEIRDAPGVENDGEEHNVQFLLINTSRGTFTMANHDIHNGYYGGFAIQAEKG